MNITKQFAVAELADQWLTCGVERGDVLLVHSNIKRLLISYRRRCVDWKVNDILQSLLTALGPKGTLLLPLFNFDFTRGTPFDFKSTPSQMGSLTEAGRIWPDAVRTGHPIYSFVAIGAQAAQFEGICNVSGYGRDSPFAILKTLSGKIGVLDLPEQDSMTFYHYVEEMHNVSYRHHKVWSGAYTDAAGNAEMRDFSLFVRNLDMGVQTAVDPMGERLWAKQLYQGFRPGVQLGMRVISAASLYKETSSVINSGKALGLLYRIES